MSVVIIYLYINEAFDKVSHKTLLTKLRLAGIIGLLLTRFHSYLFERTRGKAMPGVLSTALPITSGVFQGSDLGPIIFLLYINSIINIVKHGRACLLVDDIKIIYTCPPTCLGATALNIQSDLNDIFA